jgi:hypothetical protein
MTRDLTADREGGPLKPKSFLQGVEEGGAKVWNNATRALEWALELALGCRRYQRRGADHLGMAPAVADDAEQAQQEHFDSTGLPRQRGTGQASWAKSPPRCPRWRFPAGL